MSDQKQDQKEQSSGEFAKRAVRSIYGGDDEDSDEDDEDDQKSKKEKG